MASQDKDTQDSSSVPPQQGRHGNPPSRKPEREISLGLALSGMLIAISFISLLVPLAVYQVAQVAASVRLRTALFLLVAVVAGLGLLGFLLGSDLLLLGCVLGAFWAPLIAVSLHVRSKFQSSGIAIVAFAIPVVLFLASVFFIPQVPNLGLFLDSRKAEFLQVLQKSANIADPVLRAKVVENWQQLFAQVRALPEFDGLAQLAAYSPWQRWAWAVYGGGAPLYFGLVMVALGNLALLDFAFEQVEKFKAVAAYLLQNESAFPRPLLESLSRLRLLKAGKGGPEPLPLSIVGHKRVTASSPGEGFAAIKGRIFKPAPTAEVMQMWGFEFALDRLPKGWNFKNFALPLWLGLAAVAAMVSWVAVYSDTAGIVAAAALPHGPAIGLSSVVAFALMALLAAQGVLVLYARLTGFFLLLFLLVFLLLGSYVSLNPHLIVAVFGSVGLLDDVYDLRGRRARSRRKQAETP